MDRLQLNDTVGQDVAEVKGNTGRAQPIFFALARIQLADSLEDKYTLSVGALSSLQRTLQETESTHQVELQRLLQEKESLEKQITDLTEQIQVITKKAETTSDSLTAKVENLRSEIEESEDKRVELLGRVAKFRMLEADLSYSIERIKAEHHNEMAQLTEDLHDEMDEMDTTHQEEITKFKEELAEVSSEKEVLASTLGFVSQQVETLTERLEEVTQEQEMLVDQMSEMIASHAIASAKKEIESEELKASLQKEIEQKTAALNARIAELSDTQKSHERAISENQAQLSAKELEISNLQEELKFANDQLSAATNKEEADGKTIEALREENQNSLRQAKTHIAEVQSLRDSLNALRRQQQSLQTEQAQTVREREAFQRQVEELNVEKAQILAKEKEEYAAYDAYIDETEQEVKAKIAALNKEKGDLALQIEREQAKVREIKDAIGENPIQRVQFLESTNLSLQREVAAKNAALAVLRQEKDTAVTGRLEAEQYLEERDQQAQQSREMLIRQFAQEKAEFVEVRERLEAEVQSQTVLLEQAAQYGQQLVGENKQMRWALEQKTDEIWKMQQMLRIEREQMALEIGRLREEARRVPQTVVVQDETKIRALQQELVETRRALEKARETEEWVMVDAKPKSAETSNKGLLERIADSIGWGSASTAEPAASQATSKFPPAWMEAVREAQQPEQPRAQRMSASAAAKREVAEVPIDGDAHIAYLTTVQEAIRGVRANCNRLSFLDHAEKMRYTFVEVRNRNEEVIGYAQLDAQANVVWTNSIDAALAGLSAPKVAQMKNLFLNPMSQGMKEDYFEIRPFSDDGSAYRAHFKK